MPDDIPPPEERLTPAEWERSVRIGTWLAEDAARHMLRKRTATWMTDAGYWWRPGETQPERAPDLSTAAADPPLR